MSQRAYLRLLDKYGGDISKATFEEMQRAAGRNARSRSSSSALYAAQQEWKAKATQGVPAEMYRDARR